MDHIFAIPLEPRFDVGLGTEIVIIIVASTLTKMRKDSFLEQNIIALKEARSTCNHSERHRF